MCLFMCVCKRIDIIQPPRSIYIVQKRFWKKEKKIIIISGRSYRSPNHPTPLQSIYSSSSSSPSLFVSLPSAISLNGAVRNRPTKRTVETIGSLLRHVMSRISRLSPRPSGFRRLFLHRIFKNTQRTQIPLDPYAFLRGIRVSRAQRLYVYTQVYIFIDGDVCNQRHSC